LQDNKDNVYRNVHQNTIARHNNAKHQFTINKEQVMKKNIYKTV